MKTRAHKILPGQTLIELYESEQVVGVGVNSCTSGVKFSVQTQYNLSSFQKRKVRIMLCRPQDAPISFVSVLGSVAANGSSYIAYQIDP